MNIEAEKKKTILALKGYSCDNCEYKTQTASLNCKYRVKKPSHNVCARWSKKYVYPAKTIIDFTNINQYVKLLSTFLTGPQDSNTGQIVDALTRAMQNYVKDVEDDDK